ncbi:hypothetical protein A7U60_g8807 [Sanghuangporus baumii]|uniref:Uncharacterized protein n=1 Tax=Sanghuangporus baumii TaxID=108892 RepID=A0A9Q5HQH7_SANBA|nr:hypothetical protein A7U60_g8807 [Sanghuangporus baumii]
MRCTTCRTYLNGCLREYKANSDESVSYGGGDGGVKEVVVSEDESLRAGVDCLDKSLPRSTRLSSITTTTRRSSLESPWSALAPPSEQNIRRHRMRRSPAATKTHFSDQVRAYPTSFYCRDKQRNSPFKFKPTRDSPYKRPTLIPKSKLQTITEESEELHEPEEPSNVRVMRKSAVITSFHEDFSMNEMSDGRKEESSDDSDYEGWDDETTLVAKFQENAPEISSREKLAELAYHLEGPMQIRADQLKQHLAHTLAPATRKVKEVHRSLEQKADVAFGVGVLSFDDSCKKIEQLSLHDEDEIKDAYMKTQRNVTEYFKQLKEAYQKRNQLWDQLREAVDKSASRTLASLATLPSEVDDAAASIEKKSKDISKSTGKDSKAKLLRDLLAEI